MQNQWKGNVRELSNLVERLLILHPNEVVDASDLPAKYLGDKVADDPLAEREAILEAFTAPDEFEQSPDFAGMDDNSVISTDPGAFNPPKSNGRANAASAPTEPEAKKEDLPDLPVIRDEDDMAEAFVPRLRPEGVNLKDMITDIEISMIKQALDQTNGVVAKAAETLGLRRTTLIEKMKKYGLTAQ